MSINQDGYLSIKASVHVCIHDSVYLFSGFDCSSFRFYFTRFFVNYFIYNVRIITLVYKLCFHTLTCVYSM